MADRKVRCLMICCILLGSLFWPSDSPWAMAGGPDIRLRPNDGPVGTTTQVTAKGFDPENSGVLVWNDDSELGSFLTDGNGEFEVLISIPVSEPGTHVVTARTATQETSDEFEVILSSQPESANDIEETILGATPVAGPGQTALNPRTMADCPQTGKRTVNVSNGLELTEALNGAQPGDVILMAGGSYLGNFVIEKSGTEQERITLCGWEASIIHGGGITSGYSLHVQADYWTISGIAVTFGQKGVVLDGANFVVLDGLIVHDIGDEAVHFRSFSSDNVIQNSFISNTGLRREKFGEGIYIGSAVSNWGTYSGGEPDKSDRNKVLNNYIMFPSAEAIDIKEGTTGGLIEGNTFLGSAVAVADSWVDVKGNGYIIRRNAGESSRGDGFQTHVINDMEWGRDNIFDGNIADLEFGDGYGFYIHNPDETGNIVMCNNVVVDAIKGYANVECTP